MSRPCGLWQRKLPFVAGMGSASTMPVLRWWSSSKVGGSSAPHQPQWRALRSLVDDGVAFARGQRRGFSRVGSAAAAAPESAPSDEEDGGSGRRSRRSKEPKPVRGKGSSGKSSGKSSKKSKRSSKADKDSGGPEPTGGGAEGGHEEETAEERKQRILQEERSAGVHSSQQAIKVVGLSAT